MENITEQNNIQSKPKKKGKLKWKIYLILLLLLVGGVVYGYYWYQGTNTLRLEAKNVVEQANKYDALKTNIINESQRCKGFISQEQGDFGSFEYCKKFIQYANNLGL